MKKLLIAAAISAFAVATVPAFVGQVQAAPAKNPLCALAKQEKNPVAWNAYYGCLSAQPRVHRTMLRSRHAAPQNDFCKLAAQEKNLVAWDEFYGCWHR